MLLPLREVIRDLKKEIRSLNFELSDIELDILLSLALGVSREKLYTVDFIEEEDLKRIRFLLKERLKGIPISYIQNKRYFYDLELFIEEGVFIPRPETETLLERAFELIEKENLTSVLEIGVGSGNIVISLALRFTDLKIFASDISPKAMRIAINNAKKYNVAEKIDFLFGPYLFPILLRDLKFDLIITNPPYIASYEMIWLSKEVKKEPWKALYGGFDGCRIYKEIFQEIKIWKRGIFLFEISPFILESLKKIIDLCFKNYSLKIYKDLAGKERVLELRWST